MIAAGFACRRRGIMGPAAASELNRFVVWLALPALLFDVMAHASWAAMYQPAFVAAFGLGSAAVFVLTLGLRLRGGRHLADASVDAIAAAYPNTAYIGFPLCLIVFGASGLTPATIATILIVCVLFSIAIVLIEIGLQSERRAHKLVLKLAGSLMRNPLIVAPLAGTLLNGISHGPGDTVPAAVESLLKLLGAAASPCALVCLGLFLGERRAVPVAPLTSGGKPVTSDRGAWWLTGAKLLLQPALTWWLAARVFMLPAPLTAMAVLLAALPTGTGPFMLAEFYGREGAVSSRTILMTTVGSLLTLSLLLMHLK
jgi:predicted permease